MTHKWTKVCIQVLENNLEFCIAVDGIEVRYEKHTDKSEMENSIIDWIKYYIPQWWYEHTEFEIIRYR